MSTPDPRTERAQLDKWLLQTNRYPGTVTAGEAAQHLYDAAVKANDALTTEAARVRGETWREALEKVANDWASKGFCGHDEIQSIEVQAFLDTRHVHYPECRGELSKPTWSTARPTVPGWYWWRFREGKDPVVMKIGDDHIAKTNVFTIGTSVLLIDELPGEWLGPISPDTYRQGRVAGLREASKLADEYGAKEWDKGIQDAMARLSLQLERQAQEGSDGN